MTPAEIDAIAARAEAATAGPWAVVDDAGQGVVSLGDVPPREMIVAMTSPGQVRHADMGFIAAARTDVPALVKALREARADNARLRGLIKAAETNGCKCGLAAENTGCPWCEAQLVFDGSDRSPTDTRAVGFLPLKHTADCPAFTPDGTVR